MLILPHGPLSRIFSTRYVHISFPPPQLHVQSIITSFSKNIVGDDVRELQRVKIKCKILWDDDVKTFIDTLL
jgi:hypothetical protein